MLAGRRHLHVQLFTAALSNLFFCCNCLLKNIAIIIELMFLDINIFLALLRAYFNPRCARDKMNLSQAKNIFYIPVSIISIVILFTLWFKWFFSSPNITFKLFFNFKLFPRCCKYFKINKCVCFKNMQKVVKLFSCIKKTNTHQLSRLYSCSAKHF